MVKLNAWEKPFLARLSKLRSAELVYLRQVSGELVRSELRLVSVGLLKACAWQVVYLQGATRWLLYITPTIVTLSTVCLMWWLNEDDPESGIDTATVTMIITFINMLKFPILLIPHAASLTFEGMVRNGGPVQAWLL